MQSNKDQVVALTELNEELENYFSNTIIPQLFIDAQLVLRKFTPPAMKQFELKEEYLGMPLEQVKDNFRYPTLIDNIKSVIDTGTILEKEIQTTDNRWYQMNILPYLIRKEKRTNGVIITFVDITSRIRDLKEQEKLIAEHELLLDTVAHDLKNPILALNLTVQLLKRLPTHKTNDFPMLINNLDSSVADMRKIVGDLADSRWQQHKYQAEGELIDLQNILEDVRIALAPQIMETKAEISEQIGVSEVVFVRRKLRSVLYNLLTNAIKYTPHNRPPQISITSYEEDGYMVISVTDNGIGISEENRELIFEKFRRATSAPGGSGVGLYLVHTIVTSAGGKVTLESEAGKGSTFKVFLQL